jgi:hypothetical protein
LEIRFCDDNNKKIEAREYLLLSGKTVICVCELCKNSPFFNDLPYKVLNNKELKSIIKSGAYNENTNN